jgi:hypothetical protein
LGFIAVVAMGTALPSRPVAAEPQFVIWRSTAVGGFEWQPSSGNYASRQACEDALEGRRRRIARAIAFLRRIGVDDTLQRAVGDRIYECRPALTGPEPPAPAVGPAQSP